MLMSGRNAYGFSMEYVKISLNLHVELYKVPFVKSLSHFHDNCQHAVVLLVKSFSTVRNEAFWWSLRQLYWVRVILCD